MIPVIISGGSGTRLWPLSRAKFPKQFVNLFGESLQEKTIKRLQPLNPPVLLTGEHLRILTTKQLNNMGLDLQVIYEPLSKNTAPAIALVVKYLLDRGQGQDVLAVCPSDHLIKDEEKFRETLKLAEGMALQDRVVTLGVVPTCPEVGYGYIEAHKVEGESVFEVVKFHEKPTEEKAKEYLNKGNFYWNAGIFVFKVQAMWDLFEELQPSIALPLKELSLDLGNLREIFEKMPNISIDYAIMEKLGPEKLCVIPASFDWSDVGSWDSVVEQDERAVKSTLVDAENVSFVGVENKTYAAIGVADLVVVDTDDVLLITRRGESQRVREVVEILKTQKSSLTEEHIYEFRPWGDFKILRDTADFKSKVIHVNVGAQISYQSHAKRAEHWVIVKGCGEVVLNDEIIAVKAGDHVYIPVGAKHRIRNTGTNELEFVEVQLGAYFGEDDIVRYQDDFGRH